MAGSLFAGVEEAPGETIILTGGNLNPTGVWAVWEPCNWVLKDRYFQDVEDDIRKLVPEGIEGRVPYKGTLAEVMVQYVGGLRGGYGYCGAGTVAELQKRHSL